MAHREGGCSLHICMYMLQPRDPKRSGIGGCRLLAPNVTHGMYKGTSLIRNSPPPQDLDRALGTRLL